MLYLKKYFTEGLIQMVILLSLCGVRVDVGLEPYLPSSWHEMILGPTSALTQTQFHNLRNHLEEGHDLHPKNVDLDGFFTARRLLGWVRSLDRLQVPRAELETWLVQREPDALPVGCPDQSSTLERDPVRAERERLVSLVEPRAGTGNVEEEEEEEDKEGGTHHVLHHNGALDDRGEEEQEEDLARIQRHRNTEGGGRPGGSYGHSNNRQLPEDEADQTSFSFQECLRLLEETFPFTEEQQVSDIGGGREDRECQPLNTEPLSSPIIPTEYPSLDLELHWQDLLTIMEPENTDVGMMTSFDHTLDSRPSGAFQGVGSEALSPNSNSHDNAITEADQEVLLLETPLQHGLLGSRNQSELESALLPLTPSADLDNHNSGLNTRNILKNPDVDPWHSAADDPSEDYCMGVNAEDNSSAFDMNLLTQDVVDRTEPENLPGFDVSFHSSNLTPSSFTPSLDGNDMTQGLLVSPSSVFLADGEDIEDEAGLPSPLTDLLEDATMLDEIRLLDLALEEGLSPEMALRLEEEGYLDREIAQLETGRDDDHHFGFNMEVTEDQGQPGIYQQDGEDEVDSDSGLSLNFSHSPASPCTSEASSYSSSSSTSSTSSSCASAVGSPFSEDEEENAEEGLIGSDMEVEVNIKQEELEKEEMGAVGGGYSAEANKFFPSNYGDPKLFHGFPWLEHIGHDHTYNQPWSSASSPSLGKMPTRHTKSTSRYDSSKPYHHPSSRHISGTKMWSQDERRARALKIPFSNDLIVNLPVEEFNDLMTNYQLNEEQLSLVRDIRRRGKNKIAAQNCRKRKLDVLLGLEDDVSGLRRHRARLLREKQETLRNLQQMKRRLGMLYQEVFSRLRNEEGRPLDAREYLLHFGPNGSVTVDSRQQGTGLPLTGQKNSKKQRDKKK